jgi:hypothetical protein
MQTLCLRLQQDRRLDGSFFFKRGHPTRGNAKMPFATLAYQLALHVPRLKGPISMSAADGHGCAAAQIDHPAMPVTQ